MVEMTVLNLVLVTAGILVWIAGLTFGLIGLAVLVEKIAHR